MFRNLYQDLRHQLRYGGFWIWFLALSVFASIVFVIFQSLFQQILPDAAAFLFVSNQGSELFIKPWTLVTHAFFVPSLMSLLFQMIFLYWISYWVEDFIGRKKAIFIFIGGLLSGVIAFLICALFFQENKALWYGSSSGIAALLLAATTISPEFRLKFVLIGHVPLKYFTMAMIVFAVIFSLPVYPPYTAAMVAGGLFGYLYMVFSWKGYTIRFDHLFRSQRMQGPRLVSPRKTSPSSNLSQEEQLNKILDKIKSGGLQSLNKEEQNFLEKLKKGD